MSIPKAVGVETEYGIVTQALAPAAEAARGDPIAASQAVVGQLPACGPFAAPQRTVFGQLSELPAGWFAAVAPDSRRVSNDNGWMLVNGGRLYVDHAHPEYCTPECLSARELVAADKAGELILERCRQTADAAWRAKGRRLLLYKNNSDHKGNSYGCHENYLLSAALYEDLQERRRALVPQLVFPFLLSRTLLCGAGKVGSENGTAPAGFQLAQRADFFETLSGPQTTYHRPLFNTRDEAHAATHRYRRLHVIVGDANLAEFSTFLKIGTTQLFFQMLEDGWLTTELELADPLAAWRTVARDLQFTQPLSLARGGALSALELQHEFLAQARQYCARIGITPETAEVLKHWETTLAALPDDWRRLATRLDWAIKRNLLEKYLEAEGTDWETVGTWQPVLHAVLAAEASGAPVATDALAQAHGLPPADYARQRRLFFGLRRFDLEYHDLRRGPSEAEMGLFYRLQQRGAVERLLSDEEIQRRIEEPPPGGRAWLRGACLKQYGDEVIWADWSGLRLARQQASAPYGLLLNLPDPLADRLDEAEPALN